jgi:hypothetical protein
MARRRLKYILFLLILSGIYASLAGQADIQFKGDNQNVLVDNINKNIHELLSAEKYR